MRNEMIFLIARQYWSSVFKSRAIYFLLILMGVLLFYASFSGLGYHDQNHHRERHQEMARESWEANPDKHPHRMAHFGTFAFRLKHPLSIFDYGVESYTGNALFLEAHKQNMVNFSEASYSTGLIRFGELSMAMILQLILPLIIFFIGYASIASDRENGTLKILLTQGASWKEVLYGRSMGLYGLSVLFFLPFIIATLLILLLEDHVTNDVWMRLLITLIVYLLYYFITSFFTIIISTHSRSSKNALVTLLGLWLLLVVVLPRTAQAVGSYLYPTPTKLEFKGGIEEEVIQYGDSHNANDPYYQAIRDSVLTVHGVETIDELPFNYGGFQMFVGEKISTEIYVKHHHELLNQYRKQNKITNWLSIVNPYLGVKALSMSLCGTDLETYVDFQHQAEDYRYKLAQTMNELQIERINPEVRSSEGKINVVDRKEWESFADFSFEYPLVKSAVKSELLALISLIIWSVLAVVMMNLSSKNSAAI
ncbi:MAG: DUF3526 domain-containing protein [Bacteroidota bacterium]